MLNANENNAAGRAMLIGRTRHYGVLPRLLIFGVGAVMAASLGPRSSAASVEERPGEAGDQ